MKNFTLLFTALMTSFSVIASNPEPTEKKAASTNPANEKEMVIDNAAVTDAMREFKSLSRVDRKMRMRQVKTAIKEYKAQKAAAAQPSTNTLLLVILAILLPPLAVYLHEGVINGKFWLSILLTLLFWIPGVIYALIVVL